MMKLGIVIVATAVLALTLVVMPRGAGGTARATHGSQIVVSPLSIDFEDTWVPGFTDEPLTISNTGTADLVIDLITFTGPGYQGFSLNPYPNLPITVAPGGQYVLTVRMICDTEGFQIDELVIYDKHPEPSWPTLVDVWGWCMQEITVIVPTPTPTVPPVGGIALVNSPGSPASPADGSGSSSRPYAAIASIAAAALAFAAGGWYARRRWMR